MSSLDTSAPRKILTCSVLGCNAAWYEMPASNRVGHERAIRRARTRGWTSDGAHGCACADRDAFCPEHSAAEED